MRRDLAKEAEEQRRMTLFAQEFFRWKRGEKRGTGSHRPPTAPPPRWDVDKSGDLSDDDPWERSIGASKRGDIRDRDSGSL